jgi:hypothetical protein
MKFLSLLLPSLCTASQEQDLPDQTEVPTEFRQGGPQDGLVSVEGTKSQADLQSVVDLIGTQASYDSKPDGAFPLRKRHCADPVAWDDKLADQAFAAATCYGDQCTQDVFSTASNQKMLIYYEGITAVKNHSPTEMLLNYDKNGGENVVLGNMAKWDRINDAALVWYDDAAFRNGFDTQEGMIADLNQKDATDNKFNFASLIWLSANKIGCAASSNPALQGKILLPREDTEPLAGKLVCIIEAPLHPPGYLDPSDKMSLYWTNIHPGGYDTKALHDQCTPNLSEWKEQPITSNFSTLKESVEQFVSAIRGFSGACGLTWNEGIASFVDATMNCWVAGGAMSDCFDMTAFQDQQNNGKVAGVVTRVDTCPPENNKFGCGSAFDNKITRVPLALLDWNRFRERYNSEENDGWGTKELFDAEWAKLSDEEKLGDHGGDKDANMYALLNDANAEDIYCAVHETKFTSGHVEKAYLWCVISSKNHHVMPRNTVAEWQNNLWQNKSC